MGENDKHLSSYGRRPLKETCLTIFFSRKKKEIFKTPYFNVVEWESLCWKFTVIPVFVKKIITLVDVLFLNVR